MGNCLVTKLKGNVNNDNLVHLNGFNITVKKRVFPNDGNNYTNAQKITFGVASNLNISIIAKGNGYVAETFSELQTNPQKSLTISNGEHDVWFSNENFNIEVINKENITRMVTYACTSADIEETQKQNLFTINISDLMACPLTKIELAYTTLTGKVDMVNKNSITVLDIGASELNQNLSDFAEYPNLLEMWLGYTNIYGDLDSIATLTNLRKFNGKMTGITGDISSLINNIALNRLDVSDTSIGGDINTFASMFATKRNSGRVEVNTNNSNVTRPEGTNLNIIIRFGESMVNPTAEETAQGWQIV